tara:strand:+ start:1576 stop:1737 length:162 start_codon:yes stop_codon:yes gene_type:complete
VEFESGIVHLFFDGNSKVKNFFGNFGGDGIEKVESVIIAAFVCVEEDCYPMGS